MGVSNLSGIYYYPQTLQKLKTGKTTKQEVLELLGSPSFVENNKPNTYYYLYQKSWYVSVFKERVVAQQILIFTFDDKNLLQSFESKTLKDYKDLPLDENTTPLSMKESHIKPTLYKLKHNPQ